MLAHQGRFEESEKELAKSTKYWEETDDKQGICIDEVYRSLRALLMSNAEQSLKSAKMSYDIAISRKNENDKIQAEWLLGAAYLAKGDLNKSEKHLIEALRKDRVINSVYIEPDILLELAKVRFAQNRKEESFKLAVEALGIADRCEYRLKQADIHNFLAEFYLDAKDFVKAKEHIKIAMERAECGYKPAMDKAKRLAKLITE